MDGGSSFFTYRVKNRLKNKLTKCDSSVLALAWCGRGRKWEGESFICGQLRHCSRRFMERSIFFLRTFITGCGNQNFTSFFATTHLDDQDVQRLDGLEGDGPTSCNSTGGHGSERTQTTCGQYLGSQSPDDDECTHESYQHPTQVQRRCHRDGPAEEVGGLDSIRLASDQSIGQSSTAPGPENTCETYGDSHPTDEETSRGLSPHSGRGIGRFDCRQPDAPSKKQYD